MDIVATSFYKSNQEDQFPFMFSRNHNIAI
jgi:hypothetical protein